jgi:hypothetical protein
LRKHWSPSISAFTVLLTAGELRAQEPASQPAPEPLTCKNFLGLDAAPLTEPIITDRPDFTESTAVVPWGHLQFESGYTFTYDDEDGTRSADQTFPEYLLRIGLVEDVELRIGWIGMSLAESWFEEKNDVGRTRDRDVHDDGATDMTVGGKIHLIDTHGLVPEFSIITELSIPTGGKTKTSGDVDPQVKLLWSYDLTDNLSLSGNLNFAVPTNDDDRRFFQTAASVSLGYKFSERWGAYTEYFGFYPNDRDTDCAHYFNGGFTFLITDNIQFDVRSGCGLNEEADDFFAGCGLSFRI